jgi:ATP-dependent DNA ligase
LAGLILRAHIRGSGLCCSRNYDPNGRLVYAGRVGAGIDHAELGRLWRRLQSLATPKIPLDQAPPRSNRCRSRPMRSCVHSMRPELVVEVKYLTWTDDNLLCRMVYEGLREDEDPAEMQRAVPNRPLLVALD